MFHRQVVEEAVEDHLRQQELIATAKESHADKSTTGRTPLNHNANSTEYDPQAPSVSAIMDQSGLWVELDDASLINMRMCANKFTFFPQEICQTDPVCSAKNVVRFSSV